MSVEWWYPVFAWGVIIAAAARGLLLIAERVGLPRTPRWLPLALGAVSVVPISGLPIGRWLHGVTGSSSIPFVILLLEDTLSPLLPRPILDAPSRRAGAWFGAVTAAMLYPLALGLGSFDPYTIGWQMPTASWLVAGVAALLALIGNRFAAVIIAAGIAWQLGILESENAWEYLVDPIYGMVATLTLVSVGVRALR